MSRLANDDDSSILRIAPGFYFKCPTHTPKVEYWPSSAVSALLYAGNGAGLRKFDALNQLGWCTQLSAKVDVSTLRRVEAFKPYIRYTKHSNKRREWLTWTEVTLLEAIAFLDFTEQSWRECLEALENGISESRLPWKHMEPFRFNRERLLWAAEQEDSGDLVDLKYRINEACEAVPMPHVMP